MTSSDVAACLDHCENCRKDRETRELGAAWRAAHPGEEYSYRRQMASQGYALLVRDTRLGAGRDAMLAERRPKKAGEDTVAIETGYRTEPDTEPDRCPECGSETAEGCGAAWHDTAKPEPDTELRSGPNRIRNTELR